MFMDRKIEQVSAKHHHFYHKMFLKRGHNRSWEIQEDYFCKDKTHLKSEGYDRIRNVIEWACEAVKKRDFFSVLSVYMDKEKMEDIYWKF